MFRNLKVLKVSKGESAINHLASMEVVDTTHYGFLLMKEKVEVTTVLVERVCIGKHWFYKGTNRKPGDDRMRALEHAWELKNGMEFNDLRNGDGEWD